MLHRADCKVYGELCIQCVWNRFAEIALWATHPPLVQCYIPLYEFKDKYGCSGVWWKCRSDNQRPEFKVLFCPCLPAWLQASLYIMLLYLENRNKNASLACHSCLGCLFLRAVFVEQNPSPYWKLWVHQQQKKHMKNSTFGFDITGEWKGKLGYCYSPLHFE